MHIIYSKLPRVIIDYILCFTPQFIIRKGKLTSIFSKEDERYKMLEYITIKPVENPLPYYSFLGGSYIFNERYEYDFHNQYNGLRLQRMNQCIENDYMDIVIMIHKNGTIKYDISIYKLKQKNNNNRLRFYKGDMNNCNWVFINYRYTRT